MRIDSIQRVAQLYSSKAVKKTEKVSGTKAKDQLEISQAGRDIQIAKKAVSDAPQVREDLVNSIKKRMENGEYSVSNDDFAAKVIEKYNQFLV